MSASINDKLKVGDVLINNLHAAIFVGDNKCDGRCVVQALNGGRKGSNVRRSKLNSDAFISDISVFRCKDRALAEKAAQIAVRVSELSPLIKFDVFRLQVADGVVVEYDSLCNKDIDEIYGSFRKKGIFRAIKFTARRNIGLIKDRQNTRSKGLFCSFAVCLFYQIAGFQKLVRAADDKNTWPSNTNISMSGSLVDKIGRRTFEMYKKNIKHKKEAIEAIDKVSAMMFWEGQKIDSMEDKDFEDLITKAFMIDSKMATTDILLESLRMDQEHWNEI